MGDFEITPNAAPAGERKKLVFMTVLALVLVGVLSFHFFARTPAPAAASDRVGIAPTASEDTPAKVREALKNDPTTRMLVDTTRNDSGLDALPRNPFRMSSALRTALVKTVDETPLPTPPPRPVDPQIAAPQLAVHQPLKTDDFKLTSIMQQNDRRYAIINGSVVSAGSTIGAARVLEVHQDGVLLQRADDTDGPTTRLMLDGSHSP